MVWAYGKMEEDMISRKTEKLVINGNRQEEGGLIKTKMQRREEFSGKYWKKRKYGRPDGDGAVQ